MKQKAVALLLPVLFISACSKSPDFSCDGPAVKSTVISTATEHFNNTASQPGFTNQMSIAAKQLSVLAGGDLEFELETDYEKIKFELRNIRTAKQDRELGNYECKASLVSIKDTRESEIEISYTSETISGGKDAYVKVAGLSDYNIGALGSVLIKEKEFPEKTTRGELSYGTLDSSIGDFMFISNSEIGEQIFQECKALENCEVKAIVEESEYGDMIKKVIYVKKI